MEGTGDLPTLAPVVAYVVLLELAAGAIGVTLYLDGAGRAGRGFSGTTAAICAVVMALDLVIAATLPDPSTFLGGRVQRGDLASVIHWSVALLCMLLAFAFFCAVGTDAARRTVGAATVLVGAVTLAKAALALGPAAGGALGAAAVFFSAALLAGGALAGMLLGHWYLISPDLSFRPLRLSIYAVFVAVAVQALLIGIALALTGSSSRRSLVASSYAVPFWLLVVGSGVVFTAAVNALTLYFARIRANQPATAMLYVLIISVLMGVIPGHLLFFKTAVAV